MRIKFVLAAMLMAIVFVGCNNGTKETPLTDSVVVDSVVVDSVVVQDSVDSAKSIQTMSVPADDSSNPPRKGGNTQQTYPVVP